MTRRVSMASLGGACLVFVVSAMPMLSHAYTFTVVTPSGEVDKNQTIGNPAVWPPGETDPLDITLNFRGEFLDSAVSALQEWNAVSTALQWREGVVRAETCGDDGVNSAGWQAVTCENFNFGDALAVTNRTYTQFAAGSPWYLVQADIAVNETRLWDAHRTGPIGSTPGLVTYDFRRVFLHEVGHAMGLDHPDEGNPPQSDPAIMNSRSSNIETLQDDDIAGVSFLYHVQGSAPITVGNSSGGGNSGGGAWSPLTLLFVYVLWRIRRRR